MELAAAADHAPAPVGGAQPAKQWTDSELRSRNILGPTFFDLSELKVLGQVEVPTLPDFVAPADSPYIIASSERFVASAKLKFNKSPLTSLLMCLGTKVTINFHFEGQGRAASELDLAASIVTEQDEYEYTLQLAGVPEKVGMTPGLYIVSATAEVGPVQNKCSHDVIGYGYIAKVLLQVYPS
ncbi:MAG: hypothetical protein KME20_14005 [Kaiparowitsia implicata GSE-PSE-MK54-09C]|nr:hypothetical protein [Kaiparowitsia implicata GSE-PSE-MK54-09C]